MKFFTRAREMKCNSSIAAIAVAIFVVAACLGISIYGFVDSGSSSMDGCVQYTNCTYRTTSILNGTIIRCFVEIPGPHNTTLFSCWVMDGVCPQTTICWMQNADNDHCPEITCKNDFAEVQRFFSTCGMFILSVVLIILSVWIIL